MPRELSYGPKAMMMMMMMMRIQQQIEIEKL